MSADYDVTGKDLLEINPADWLSFLGQPRPPERVRTIGAELSTIVRAADKVLWVDDPEPWILHIEFQTSWDGDLPERTFAYNALLRQRHKVPVVSVVILLRPAADGSAITGSIRTAAPFGTPWEFRYEVLRLWQLPSESILQGPLSLLPYAPLSQVDEMALPSIVERMKERIDQEANDSLATKLWDATFILMGLKYTEELSKDLLSGVKHMKDSVTYQAIRRDGLRDGLREGSEKEARKIVFLLGQERFGPPNATIAAAIDAINSVEALETLSTKLLRVSSWTELLNAD